MNTPLSTTVAADFPEVAFGRSMEGFAVARVGDNAFAMIPGRDGRHYLAAAWRLPRPLDQWVRADFYGHSGELADDAAFQARVLENADHHRERRALGRRGIHSRAYTPWGTSQGATVYADGVTVHSTAGHGGFHLSAERNGRVNPSLRARDGWYEEDCAWAVVAITFPHLFTSFERRCAERTIKDTWPDAWEAISGTLLEPGESREKDRGTFEAAHANDWIVISAITSSNENGFVEVVATRGGKRGADTRECRFLVPCEDYRSGPFGFVVDEARHRAYNGPSSFLWLRGRQTP
jgi:hypothetical protein